MSRERASRPTPTPTLLSPHPLPGVINLSLSHSVGRTPASQRPAIDCSHASRAACHSPTPPSDRNVRWLIAAVLILPIGRTEVVPNCGTTCRPHLASQSGPWWVWCVHPGSQEFSGFSGFPPTFPTGCRRGIFVRNRGTRQFDQLPSAWFHEDVSRPSAVIHFRIPKTAGVLRLGSVGGWPIQHYPKRLLF